MMCGMNVNSILANNRVIQSNMSKQELKEVFELTTPHSIVTEAIENYGVKKLYVLFSGGKNSVVVADYIARYFPERFAGCVFTNTGLGSQETRNWVIGYCYGRNWELTMTWPKEKERFHNILMKHGFAGAGNHNMWMAYLKYHSWQQFIKDHLEEKPALISGVFKRESFARTKLKIYSKKPIDTDGKMIFVKPMHRWNAIQFWDYFYEHKLAKSPVYDWFNKSGECYCGAFAEPWELKLLEKFDPLAFNTIKWEEEQIQLYGSKKARKYPTWGSGPKTVDVKAQRILEDYCAESCSN